MEPVVVLPAAEAARLRALEAAVRDAELAEAYWYDVVPRGPFVAYRAALLRAIEAPDGK